MDYSEALQFLYGLSRFGMRLGLDIPRRLAESAGSPERDLAFIHVAGTNGKGSTCAFLESVYRRSGRRVGLYTSPHLVSFRERIQVNREMIPEADVARLARDAQALLKELPAGAAPTFFEFVTLLALLWFREQRCDLVLWETGLGGRLDATNIVRPLASVITNIGWDHMQWLGGTLQEIAREKAAIVKPGVPVITAATQGAGLEEIERAAVAAGAPLRIVRADGAEARVVRAALRT
jgi:dihydrofolate synthase/folylpolyglutamate synthase